MLRDSMQCTTQPVPAVLDTEVLIVGAGPTGLTLANALALNGIDVHLIDRQPAVPTLHVPLSCTRAPSKAWSRSTSTRSYCCIMGMASGRFSGSA
jgi:cation diffusion facilitator CzcD-associated flavoprotein CzcO